MNSAAVATHHHIAPLLIAAAICLLLIAVAVVGWILPITLGVRAARRKNYSPYWMWFGIHPVLGWIACIVLLCLTPRIQCRNCGGFVMNYWRVCPHCHVRFDVEGSGPCHPQPPSS